MHDDHGLREEHMAFVRRIHRTQAGFFIVTTELPESLPDLISAIWGPNSGDPPVPESEVFYRVRGNRRGPSRMVNRPGRPTRKITIIGNEKKIFTAFGGPAAPKEPWDRMDSPEEIAKSWSFWNQHALSAEEFNG